MTRVLAVDDDPSILRTLQINLRARTYEIETVRDGRIRPPGHPRSRCPTWCCSTWVCPTWTASPC